MFPEDSRVSSSFIEVGDHRLHYVEDGDPGAPTVVFLHGNPTWSYLYRSMFPPVVGAGYRILAPDHLGFGRSDKPPDPALYTVRKHVERLDSLLSNNITQEAVVVAHDWGGPLGMGWGIDHTDKIKGFFFMSTGTFLDLSLPLFFRLLRAPGIGELCLEKLNLFTELMIPAGTYQRQRLRADVMRNYRRPFRDPSSRTGILAFPRMIPDSPEEARAEKLVEIRERVRGLNVPAFICRGIHDPAFGPEKDRSLEQLFPSAPSEVIRRASHYMQEDRPRYLTKKLVDFLGTAFE